MESLVLGAVISGFGFLTGRVPSGKNLSIEYIYCKFPFSLYPITVD